MVGSPLVRRALAAIGLAGATPFAAAALGAQQPERTGFYLISNGDTIFTERSQRTPSALSGDFVDVKRGARIAYVASLTPDGLVTRLETRLYGVGADTTGRLATIELGGDSVAIVIGAAVTRVPIAKDALVALNASAAFMEQMLLHGFAIAHGAPSVSFPVFLVQANASVPVVVTFIGTDSATIAFANVTIRAAISPAGRLLGAIVPAQHLVVTRGPEPVIRTVNRYAAPADAPYTAEDVEIRTPAGIRLTGTLTIPRGRATGRAPAVVTITGSGPQDRDDESPYLPGIRAYRELADTLGRRGIAVLRMDDRGINGSDAGPPTATSADFANDIRAGVAYLRTRDEIDPARIGLVGHSEGGIIAPMIAATDPRLRAIVLLAGTASPGRAIVMQQNMLVIDSVQHLRGATRDSAIALASRGMDSVARAQPWMQFFLTYDPAEMARRVTTPVLILQGERDSQVPPSEAAKLAAAFRAGGNTQVTVRLFPETNHLFLADANGAFYDAEGRLRYGTLPSLHVRPEVLGAIADWLTTQFR